MSKVFVVIAISKLLMCDINYWKGFNVVFQTNIININSP